MQWQPIETAPKANDVELLLYNAEWPCMRVGRWSSISEDWEWDEIELSIDPTHWMPLPPPPGARDA